MTLPAGTRLGSYEVVSPLGAGAMGAVYRAKDPRLGRSVAIKVISERALLMPGALQRFEQEARSASAIAQRNIVTVHEICEVEGAEPRRHYREGGLRTVAHAWVDVAELTLRVVLDHS